MADETNMKGLFKDMTKYFPSYIAPAIVGFITIPIVTHLFPAKIYGNYVLVVVTVSILSIIAGWVSMSVIRFYPAYKRDLKLDEFYGTVIKLIILSIVGLFLISLSILFLGKSRISADIYRLMCIGLLVFILTTCFGVLLSFLRARRQVNWYSTFFVWKSVTTLGFGIALIMIFHFNIEGLLWGSILSMAIALPLLLKIAVERPPTRAKGISIPLSLEMAKYGFPLVGGNLAAWILNLSDRYILEFFRGSHEVGIYSVSYGISEKSILLIVSLFLGASAPITLSIWENKGKKASQEFVTKLTRAYLIVCLPAVVGLSTLAKPFVDILTTKEYYEGYRIIPLVASGAFFLGLYNRFGVGIAFYKRTYLILFCLLISGLLNLGLNFFLIPRYGYIAAAATTLVSYVFLLVLMIFVSRRYFVWEFPFKSLVKVACSSAIMGIVVYYIGNSLTPSTLLNLILGVVVGVVVYSLMLFLLREFKPSEIQVLLDLKRKIRR